MQSTFGAAMTSDRERKSAFAAEHDVPIPYLRRTRDYYAALGYGAPYRWACYSDVPFQPLLKPLSADPDHDRHHGGPVPTRTRAIRVPARPTMRRPSSTPSTRATRRRATICASRTSPSTGSTRPPRTRPPTFRWPSCAAAAASGRIGSHRRRASMGTDQSQPAHDARGRWSGDRRPAARPTASMPRSWCPIVPSATRASASSPGCWRRAASPPSSWAAPRTSWSTSACRASCSPTSRSATQPAGRTIRASHAFTLELALSVLETSAGGAHDRAIAAALERQSRLEARLQQRRTALAGRDRAPAGRIRSRQDASQTVARGGRHHQRRSTR